MDLNARKLKLMDWLKEIQDEQMLVSLEQFIDSHKQDWYHDLSEMQKSSLEQGLIDIDEGNLFSNEQVKRILGR